MTGGTATIGVVRKVESRPRMSCTFDGCKGEVVANAGGTALHHASAYGVGWPLDVDHRPSVTVEDLERHVGAERVALLSVDELERMTTPGRRLSRGPKVRP